MGKRRSGVRGEAATPPGTSLFTPAAGCSGENSGSGNGVYGYSSGGYGGLFNGGLAPLCIQPSNTQGPPASGAHNMGELYVDTNGVLYFCTASGTPGTWKIVQLV
jgi:hypothetical protein